MERNEEIKCASKDYVNYLLDKQEYHNEKYTEHDIKQAFEKGANQADEHPYWRPATEHPIADVEVIALVGKYLKVVFAHIVKDRERVVDYDGWNIPEVKWWMPIQSIGEPEENEQ